MLLRVWKNLLKNIIKENFVNIEKENELQKSLNCEREKETNQNNTDYNDTYINKEEKIHSLKIVSGWRIFRTNEARINETSLYINIHR